jgi:3-oxoacyl-[acyl-carrier-protein] synthase-1
MAPNDVVVLGVGVMSAVGLSAQESAASIRAGTMRFTASSFRDHRFEPFTLAEVEERGLPALASAAAGSPELSSRESRLLRLAAAPLHECLTPLGDRVTALGLALALPESTTTRPLDGDRFLTLLAAQMGGIVNPGGSNAAFRGRAGGLVAIGAAAEMIRTGQAAMAIAGAIDTYRDLYVLGTLDLEKRVKSSAHLDGFIPGEGAAFILLGSRHAAQRAGLAPMAVVSRVAQGFEKGHQYSDEPYLGAGLAETIGLLAAAGELASPAQEVYSSINGESFWGKEWGVAHIRNKASFTEAHRFWHPADCWGDTGAAAGPMMVALGALGLRDGYRNAPCLVYCSSDRGGRAALALLAP